ncbi:HU family DNA-binding protein [Candidatus Bipolaricaulota bacterium]|nr:HU family DNA-binding protein [Candidatus Bipolaricaulota bacterium]HBR10220.1 integration host factor subunit alpha [Candidatus Acetothermia bacterium]
MNKSELINRLADTSQLTKKDAHVVLNSILTLIEESLLRGEEVKLVGFGKFAVRGRKASSRMNPQTKQPIKVPEKVVPVFRPGKDLKKKIEKNLKMTKKGIEPK